MAPFKNLGERYHSVSTYCGQSLGDALGKIVNVAHALYKKEPAYPGRNMCY